MLDRQVFEYAKLIIRIFLIFYGTADYNIFISIAPIIGNAVRKPIYAFCQKKKRADLPLPDLARMP